VIIQTGGEDHETITKVIQEKYGKKVSHISLMLSFSFFHGKSREDLKKTIERNLKEDGEVLIFTIDGDVVNNFFGSIENGNTNQFINANTRYDPETGKLWIDIPSTIVSDQEEIPPKLSNLFIEWDNFEPLGIKSADEELLMNPDEKRFSQMFKSFKLKPKSKTSEYEKENIISFGNGNDQKWYSISVEPSQYLFLSIVLKSLNPEYQNNHLLSFRRKYEESYWTEIQNYLSEDERKKYSSLTNPDVLELLSDIFNISILYIYHIDENTLQNKKYGKGQNKIIIYQNRLIGKMDNNGLLQTLF
jgi:hypothetical protein